MLVCIYDVSYNYIIFQNTPMLGLLGQRTNKMHFICSLFEQTPHGRILQNDIFRTNLIEGNLPYTCINDSYLQLGHYNYRS